jgi:hypothetical protein
MQNLSNNEMEPIPGKPGLILMAFGGIFHILGKMSKDNVTFILGTTATMLAIIYYSILIIQKIKSKK